MVVAGATALGAQGPIRHQPVHIPGTDIVLDDGWTLIYTEGVEYRCIYAVPASWLVSQHGWRAADPRGSVLVEVSVLDYANWSAHRSSVRRAVPAAALREDTPRRLRVELQDGARTWQHVAEGDGLHVCTASIDGNVSERVEQVIQKIASTVHLAHPGDMSWMKKD